MKYRIDLISDTSTRPSAGMLAAMAEAETGDEQRGEDPTTLALCAEVARMLGMEDAIFLPSGTMCNQIAFLVHCRPGDEILAAGNSHIFRSEGAGAAALAGAQIATIPTASGIFTAEDVTTRLRAPRDRSPVSRLISVEQTTNSGGGAIWPLDVLAGLRDLAAAEGLILHMDGARLMNACVKLGVSPADMLAEIDSVSLCLSKGLGAPAGSVLAGSKEMIRKAHRIRKLVGGGMRQIGVLAAAGIYALDHHIDRLADDHANALRLAEGLQTIPQLDVSPDEVQTNMVFVGVPEGSSVALQAHLLERGILINRDEPTIRLVTHLDSGADEVDLFVAEMKGFFA